MNEDIKYHGSKEYKKKMQADNRIQEIIKFCKDNDLNLQGFVDKSDPNAAKNAMGGILDAITGDNDAK